MSVCVCVCVLWGVQAGHSRGIRVFFMLANPSLQGTHAWFVCVCALYISKESNPKGLVTSCSIPTQCFSPHTHTHPHTDRQTHTRHNWDSREIPLSCSLTGQTSVIVVAFPPRSLRPRLPDAHTQTSGPSILTSITRRVRQSIHPSAVAGRQHQNKRRRAHREGLYLHTGCPDTSRETRAAPGPAIPATIR